MIVNENKIMNTKQKLSYVKLRELLRKSSPSLEESILINNTLREDPEILMGFESTFLQDNILRQLFNVADSLGINNFKVINRFVASLKKQKATTLRLIKTDLNDNVWTQINKFLVGRVSDENKDINTTKLPQVNQFDLDRIDQFCVVWDNLWMIESIKPIINTVDWEEAPKPKSLMVDALKARLNPLVNPPTFKSYLLFKKIPSIGSLYSDIQIHPWDSIDLFDKKVESGNRSYTTCFSGKYQPYLMSQKHWGYKHYSNEESILGLANQWAFPDLFKKQSIIWQRAEVMSYPSYSAVYDRWGENSNEYIQSKLTVLNNKQKVYEKPINLMEREAFFEALRTTMEYFPNETVDYLLSKKDNGLFGRSVFNFILSQGQVNEIVKLIELKTYSVDHQYKLLTGIGAPQFQYYALIQLMVHNALSDSVLAAALSEVYNGYHKELEKVVDRIIKDLINNSSNVPKSQVVGLSYLLFKLERYDVLANFLKSIESELPQSLQTKILESPSSVVLDPLYEFFTQENKNAAEERMRSYYWFSSMFNTWQKPVVNEIFALRK